MTYERATALIGQLEGEIAALLRRAEAADVAGEEDPQGNCPPRGLDKLDAARRHLEAQAEARAAAEREAFEAKVAAKEAPGSCQGQASEAAGRDAGCDTRKAISDPDSRLMRKSKQHEYRQAYNAFRRRWMPAAVS